MNITIQQVILACVFLAILALVEGVYLLIRGSDGREQAVNRRMKMQGDGNGPAVSDPSLMRKQVIGGPVSRAVLHLFPRLEQMFWTANVSMTPASGLLIAAGAAVAIFFVIRFVIFAPVWLAFAVAAVVGFGIPFLILNFAVDRQRRKFSEQLPDAINLITRGLQAGHPVPVALGLVAREMADPIGGEFGHAMDEINFGRDRDLALREVGKKYPDPDFRFFLSAIEMQRETGGNLVGILDNLTKIIRERTHMRKKAYAVSAEGRLTCLIVGSLPYVLLGFLLLTNPTFITDVMDHPMFWTFMGGAFFLWLVGIIWIWRMVNIKV